MAKSARARSTGAAGALGERLRRVSSWRSSAVSGRRGSVWWRDMGHLGARGSSHHHTRARAKMTHYTLGVIGKAGIGTPHMDGNTRLCTATAAAALKETFGSDGQPGSYYDID